MYLEHFHLNYLPFAKIPDPDIFFQDAGHGEILNRLVEDFVNGKPLVRITGEEGSGKTLLCKCLLLQPLGRQFDFVYLDNPVGSLNDLLHGVCVHLGMDPSALPSHDMIAELQHILSNRTENEKKVILIIDEAERLFLAALERLMRLICEAGENHLLQVLLVGRPSLAENLDQLTSYCSDVDINSGYTLIPLTAEETAAYLDFRLKAAGSSESGEVEVFTREAAEKIAAKACGDLRQVNFLADQALQSACSGNATSVLPHHIAAHEEMKKVRVVKRPSLPAVVKEKKTWLLAGGVLVALVFLVSMFTGKSKKEAEDIISIPEQQVEIQVPKPQVEVQAAQDQVFIPEPLESPQEVVAPTPPEFSQAEVIEVVEEVMPEPVVQHSPEESIVELRPERVKVAAQEPRKTVVIIEPPATHTQSATKYKAVPVNSVRVPAQGEQVFQERIRASAKWLANAYHNRYTVQMMMLASEQAAPNIKRMLAQDEYLAIKDYLYILTKKTSPPTLFIFYGTYSSMEQARQARNNMPLFLRKHHPYALSITDAMKKTQD